MAQNTPLHGAHVAAGARMVDFGGWDMPINYGSQLEEHHAVRQAAGMFDVSHMTIVDIQGGQARAFLARLLANDVGKLQVPGKALYSCMLQEDGGVIDDLIVYYLAEDWFRLVVNAATREQDLSWIRAHAGAMDVAGVAPSPYNWRPGPLRSDLRFRSGLRRCQGLSLATPRHQGKTKIM